MERKLKIFQIVVWSLVAVFLIGLLVSFIRGDEGANRFFPLKGFVFSIDGPLTETQNQTFSVSEFERIDVDCTTADITVKESDSDEIRVVVKSSEKEEEQTISIEREDKTLRVRQKELDRFFAFYNTNQIVEISLPRGYKGELQISDHTGDIDFSGNYSFNKAAISTSTGEVHAKSLTAKQFDLSGSTGDILIDSLNAEVYSVTASTADINIGNIAAGHGKISSSTGDIQVGMARLSGNVDVSSSTGDIALGLSDQINAHIEAKASTGSILSELPLLYTGEIGKRATGELGNAPLYDLTVSTSTGDISFNKGLIGNETEE